MKFTLIGWIVGLFALYLFNKTRTGHTLIYWGLILIAVFLFLGNYDRILPIITKKEE
jgi:hypothetical protein